MSFVPRWARPFAEIGVRASLLQLDLFIRLGEESLLMSDLPEQVGKAEALESLKRQRDALYLALEKVPL
jgi:hypothetical protein